MSSMPSLNATASQASTNEVVFVFLPGSWHTVNYFQPIRDHLNEMGYESAAIGHKALELINPGNSFLQDASKVEAVIKGLLEEGKNVVLVMHSYGGLVGTQAVGRLLSDMKSASDDGNTHARMGKVLNLVYVTALIPLEGESVLDVGMSVSAIVREDPSAADLSAAYNMVDGKLVCKEQIKELLYDDLEEPDRQKYFSLLQDMPISVSFNTTPVTHAGWQHVPSTYVFATKDRVVTPRAQQYMVEKVNSELVAQSSLTKKTFRFQTAEINSDHCSMFILPKHVEELGKILVKACQ